MLIVLTLFQKGLIGLVFRKAKLPGMVSGTPDVYGKGLTREQDSKFRDMYTRGKRGNRKQVTSYAYVPIMTGLSAVLSAGIVFAAVPIVTEAVTTSLADSGLFSVQAMKSGDVLKEIAFGGWYSSLSYGFVAATTLLAHALLKTSYKRDNVDADHTDIDHYEDDAYIQEPVELPYNFDIFPDAGAHSDVSPTAVLSHMMFSNKGINKISTPTGDLPFIDEKFGDDLFTASFIPKGKDGQALRHFYDTTKLLYNPTHVRDKSGEKTVAEHINKHWTFPDYEVQRPAGAYIVDTAPNNTMVLAMTRAGKGQTIIEPTIDMWTREKHLNNMAINDPKGELYVRFYYPASVRGLDVVCFNLMNPSRTNIYNPLGYAVDAARQGDNQKVEELVASIGDVFFSTENSDDPMWNNAANAAFKRSALGLIDYYQEEEREMRLRAIKEGMSIELLDQKLDEMWGRVTLYNVYQMMTELASKKSNDPDIIHLDSDDPSEEKDYLTLFFDATNKLPKNGIRTSVANQDNSLRAMAGSDKTIASVYGISLTAMLFFADEKISRLTSGRPSQNFDMIGLAFPRRMGVRFDSVFMRQKNLRGQPIKWTAYRDKAFTDMYEGDDFSHEGRIDSNGWATFFFKGLFEGEKTYLRLDISDDVSGLLAYTYYFEFEKGYQMSLNGRTYVEHPVLKERIVHNGFLREMRYKKGMFTYEQSTRRRVRKSLATTSNGREIVDVVPIFDQTEIKYTEKPKAIFFVTPPHLMSYAKIILILLNQAFNMQVDKAYLTKANQKPLHKTRYMLDEVGNLQSEGNGIPYLNTKESIGLGQEQQYTLILQTLQQLKDVYGDSVDKILQGNTGNIIYLKSTDDSMLETLEKMSGKRHVAYTDSKTVTKNLDGLSASTEGNVSYTTAMKEVPTITKEHMLFIPPCNAMVFGKGHPIWARNEMAMPMAWRLHMKQLCDPQKPKYELNTVPTTSNTDEFDVISNKPNFIEMVTKRAQQARYASSVRDQYMKVYGLDEDAMSRIPPEELSKELMIGINERINGEQEYNDNEAKQAAEMDADYAMVAEYDDADYEDDSDDVRTDKDGVKVVTEAYMREKAMESTDFTSTQAATGAIQKMLDEPIFAQRRISRALLGETINQDLLSGKKSHNDTFTRNRRLDEVMCRAYIDSKPRFASNHEFTVDDKGSLYRGDVCLIRSAADELQAIMDAGADENVSHIQQTPDYQAPTADTLSGGMQYEPQDAFYQYLASLPSWQSLIDGVFEQMFIKHYDTFMALNQDTQ